MGAGGGVPAVARSVDVWWPEPHPRDRTGVERAREVIEGHARRLHVGGLGGDPEVWNPRHPLRALVEAFHVRTDELQNIWLYDPQVAHYVGGVRAAAIWQRALSWMLEIWKCSTATNPAKGTYRQYGPFARNELEVVLRTMPPSYRPGEPLDPFLLGFENGVIDVREEPAVLRPHAPTTGITRVMQCAYHPTEKKKGPPRFSEFVGRLVPDKEERGLVQEALGVAASELVPPQEMVVLVGAAGGGKTTLLGIVEGLIGEQYCRALSPRDIGESPFVKSQLRGVTANFPTDLSQMSVSDTAPFKEVLGRDLMTAQVKHSNTPLQFKSRATWVGATNALPNQRIDTTEGFYRRWAPVTAAAGFDQRLADFAAEILADPVEVAGIVGWLLEGMRRYITRGQLYDIPRSVLAHRETWRTAGSASAAFVASHIVQADDPHRFLSRKLLLAAFDEFLDREGYPARGQAGRPSNQSLYKEVRHRFPRAAATEVTTGDSERRGFLGLLLNPAA